MSEPLLRVEGLTVAFPADGRWVPVVQELDLAVDRGEIVGLVGESGCGKSMTALALLRLVPPPGRIRAGRILLDGVDLLGLPEARLREIRGGRLAMIFQEPMTALNPVFTIGFQIAEAIRVHRKVARAAARRRAGELLELVAMPDPGRRLDAYPHELSGGQRQRAMIAMSLAAEPDLLIADEPTTALDVTVQAQILELLERLRKQLGLAVLLITHDLAVVAESCERALVMYAGRMVEEAVVERLFAHPAHPYSRGLLGAVPRLGRPAERGRLPTIDGRVPEPACLPSGCAFHPRCPEALAVCAEALPERFAVEADHIARCVLWDPRRSGS